MPLGPPESLELEIEGCDGATPLIIEMGTITVVKPPSDLLIIWTTPITSPLMQMGMHKMLWVVYPVCSSIEGLNLGSS